MRQRWRGKFAAALATLWLGLTALSAAPARAQDEPDVAPAEEASLSPGPQVLVIADELGNVLVAEEPSPQEDAIVVLDSLLMSTPASFVAPLVVTF